MLLVITPGDPAHLLDEALTQYFIANTDLHLDMYFTFLCFFFQSFTFDRRLTHEQAECIIGVASETGFRSANVDIVMR